MRHGARGCCTVEDANDARRSADVLGIPFYVWDLAERFRADVIDDFVAEYAAGRTPNPCLRCNEKIKFAAVLDRALALGFDAVVTGHHARWSTVVLTRSVDVGQGPVLRAGRADRATQLAHAMFPLGDSTKAQVRAEAARRGLAVADKPDSHDICFIPDGDTRGFLQRELGERSGPIVDASHGAQWSASTMARSASPSASAAACILIGPHADGAAALRAVHPAGDQHGPGRARGAARGRRGSSRDASGVDVGRSARSRHWSARCSCGRTAWCPRHGDGIRRPARRAT